MIMKSGMVHSYTSQFTLNFEVNPFLTDTSRQKVTNSILVRFPEKRFKNLSWTSVHVSFVYSKLAHSRHQYIDIDI